MKNLKQLILKYKYQFLLVIFLIIIISLINTLLLYIIEQTIELANNNIKFNDIKIKLILLVISYLIITLICAILEFFKSTTLAKNSENLICNIREITYKRIINFKL